MSTALYILAYILLAIATAIRFHRDTANGYSVEPALMAMFTGIFWPAAWFAVAILALWNAALTVWSWPPAERWSRLRHEIKRRLRR